MIIVIRDIEAATSNANLLSASGVSALPLAVVAYEPIELDSSIFDTNYQSLIFTSKHAILHQASFYNLPAWCVGSTTAKAAQNAGYKNVITSLGNAKTLVKNLSKKTDRKKGPLLWVSGADTAFDIEEYLKNKKFRIHRAISYRMRPSNHLPNWFTELVKSNEITGIIILSKRNFQCFKELMITANIWEYHKKWQLFTFEQIPFKPEEVSFFSGITKSGDANFEHLFKVIKDWYSTKRELE